jgi:hypothetical protein
MGKVRHLKKGKQLESPRPTVRFTTVCKQTSSVAAGRRGRQHVSELTQEPACGM